MDDFVNPYRNDPIIGKVSLGLDTEHFVGSDSVGRNLIGRARRCREEALEALAAIDPTLTSEICALQWKARIPELFLSWLDEAIAEGRAAEEIILQEEADEP